MGALIASHRCGEIYPCLPTNWLRTHNLRRSVVDGERPNVGIGTDVVHPVVGSDGPGVDPVSEGSGGVLSDIVHIGDDAAQIEQVASCVKTGASLPFENERRVGEQDAHPRMAG